MENVEIVQKQFNSYCIKSINNSFRDLLRHEKYIKRHETTLDDGMDAEIFNSTCCEYDIVSINGFECRVYNESIFKALNRLNERARNIIMLKYWQDMNYREVSELLGIPQRTVNYVALKSLNELKKYIMRGTEDDRL